MKRKPKINFKPRNAEEATALSRYNAKKMVEKRDNLKSWGQSGWVKSKLNKKWISYRSKLELEVIRLFESRPDLIAFYDEEKLVIPYHWKAGTRYYVPDFVLRLVPKLGATVYVAEVKYEKEHNEPKNQAKWRAAQEWCKVRGAKFIVISETNQNEIVNLFEGKDSV